MSWEEQSNYKPTTTKRTKTRQERKRATKLHLYIIKDLTSKIDSQNRM